MGEGAPAVRAFQMSQIFWMRLAAFGDVLLMLLLAVASALTWLAVWSNLGSVLDFLATTEFTAGQLGSVNVALLIVSAALTLVVFGVVRLRVGAARESRSIAIYSISILAIVIATSVLYAVAWPCFCGISALPAHSCCRKRFSPQGWRGTSFRMTVAGLSGCCWPVLPRLFAL
jgi:hypothetical protein